MSFVPLKMKCKLKLFLGAIINQSYKWRKTLSLEEPNIIRSILIHKLLLKHEK